MATFALSAARAQALASEMIARRGVTVTILRPPAYPVVKAIVTTDWDTIGGSVARLSPEMREFAGVHGAILFSFDADSDVQVGELVSWTDGSGRERAYALHEARGLPVEQSEVLRAFLGVSDATQG